MESFNEVIEKSALNDWVESETRQLDVVASWESLCDTYRILEFTDPISDTVKMEEFKWIIKEMNKHLTRARKQLLSCQNPEAMIETLENMFVPTGGTTVSNRMDLAYHKLRQRWVGRMLSQLSMMIMDGTLEERETNGGSDF